MALPKSSNAIESDYADCQRTKSLVNIDKESYAEYVVRAQKDLASAQADFDDASYHWAIIKAYQAVFFISNALLVKFCGYYSKDHRCIITALLKEKIVSEAFAEKLGAAISKVETLDKVDGLRLERNKALYQPTAWKDITREAASVTLSESKSIVEEVLKLL